MKAFILHHTAGTLNAWDNLTATYNADFNPGLQAQIRNVETRMEPTRVYFFQKVDQRLILTAGDHADLLFVRPYTKELDTPMALDFSDIVDAIEKSENHTVIFATPLDEANSPETAHKAARFFYREEIGHIHDITHNKTIDIPEYSLIPWFFASKYGDTDIYMIVLNHYAIQSVANIDGRYEVDPATGFVRHQDIYSKEELIARNEKPGDFAVFCLDNHTSNLKDIFLALDFSRNVKLIGDNILVDGDSFTIKPFDNYFMNTYAYGMAKDLKLKIHTNFDYTIDENKLITVKLDKNKGNTGYLYVRIATGPMKYAKYFYNAKNVLSREFVIHRIGEQNGNVQ
jgi:hypothetical protein